MLAAANPDRRVLSFLFAIGFWQTTAPPNAMAIWMAKRRGLKNFSALVSHVLVPPAMTAVLSAPGNRVQGFLGPGHVCSVVGTAEEYEPDRSAGIRCRSLLRALEPVDLLEGLLSARSNMLEAGRCRGREPIRAGECGARRQSPIAKALIQDVF